MKVFLFKLLVIISSFSMLACSKSDDDLPQVQDPPFFEGKI